MAFYVYVGGNSINALDPWGLFTSAESEMIKKTWTATGAAIGSFVGFFGGGGSGFLTGPAAVAAVPAGAYTGAAAGGVAGGIIGNGLATGIINMVGSNEQPGTSKERKACKHGGGKKQVDSVAKKFKMNSIQRNEFGNYIEEAKAMVGRGGNDNLSYSRMIELVKEYLGL